MRVILGLLLVTLFCSCGGHSNKSVPESAKVGASVVAASPAILVGGSMIGGRKIAQKSAIVTKAPAKWYAEEITGEEAANLDDTNWENDGKMELYGKSWGSPFFFT